MTVRDVDSSSIYNPSVFSFENKSDLVRTSCPILVDDVFVQLPFASPNGFEFCCSEARIVESQTEIIIILVSIDEKRNCKVNQIRTFVQEIPQFLQASPIWLDNIWLICVRSAIISSYCKVPMTERIADVPRLFTDTKTSCTLKQAYKHA